MRRSLPFLILFAAAAMLNVLVAWGCVLWSPSTSGTAPPEASTPGDYPAFIPGPYGESNWWFTATGFGVWQAVPSGARGADGQFLYFRGTHTPAYYRGGWPARSLQSTVAFYDYRARWDLPRAEILRRGMQTSWFPTWMHVQEERRLPLIPLWGGFAVNTLLYCFLLVALRLLLIRVLKRTPNMPDAVSPAVAPRFAIEAQWRRVTDLGR